MTNQLQQQARERIKKDYDDYDWIEYIDAMLDEAYESGRESMREEVIAIVKSWQTDEPEEVNLILENILSALNPKEYNQGSYWYSKEEDGYKDKNCKNCKDLHNGSIIKVDNNNNCLFCGRKVGSNQSQ